MSLTLTFCGTASASDHNVPIGTLVSITISASPAVIHLI